MNTKLVFVLLSLALIFSCSRTYKLTQEDFQWMPYKGNETLVFRANTGKVDTIFLLKKDTLLAYPEAQSLNGIAYEIVSVFGKHTDPTEGEHRYLENNLFQISKGKDKHAELKILYTAEDAWFYRETKIRIDSLETVKPSALKTPYGDYNDVFIFYGEDISGYSKRSNFITKLYWSISHGLIRYDKKNSVYWELSKKW